MVLCQVLLGIFSFVLGLMAETKLGLTGLVLLGIVSVGIRVQRTGLAVGAAVVFAMLMTQA